MKPIPLSAAFFGMAIAFACTAAADAAPATAASGTMPGETYFRQNCASCHTADPARGALAGPGLYGVVGRKAGGLPGYAYSEALVRAGARGKVWTREALDDFLADPARAVPGTAMPLNVPDKARRAELVAWLATLSGKAGAPDAPVAARAAAPGFGTWSEDVPGKVHRYTVDDLPVPYATASAGNGPKQAPRPEGAMPRVPDGFLVTALATDPDRGRLLLRAPNGDIFISVPSKGQVKVLRAGAAAGSEPAVFASGLSRPYGMAFHPQGADPQYLYVANINSVVRIPYRSGDQKARGAAETVVPALTEMSGGHTTRTLQFSPDGRTMLLSVGSATNVAEQIERTPPEPLARWEEKHGLGAPWGIERDRAMVLAFDPDGKNRRSFATGLRNCVGMIVHPDSGDLFCSVNERDALGDNLPFDYLTRVKQGAFYGWPWYYIGGHEDPRLAGVRPDLKDKVTVPDLLLQAHSAPLGFTVYHAPPGAKHAFPKEYEGDIFLALHGSWNRAVRTGYKVVRIPMKNGVPAGDYIDFMTGMVLDDREVWGRPASVAVAADGALLVADDASGTIWRIVPR